MIATPVLEYRPGNSVLDYHRDISEIETLEFPHSERSVDLDRSLPNTLDRQGKRYDLSPFPIHTKRNSPQGLPLDSSLIGSDYSIVGKTYPQNTMLTLDH